MTKIYLNAGSANQVDPAIARLSNGNLVIAFSNGGSSQDGRIYFYLLDSKGNVTSDLKTVTSSTQFSFTEPRISVTPDNTFLISYQYATDSSIFTSKYSNSGVLLSSTTYARQAGTVLELNSDLTTYDTETTLLLYEIRTQSGDYEIGGRFLDRLGSIVSTTPAFIVNQNSLGNQTSPDATLLSDGNFAIVWREISGAKLKLVNSKNITIKSDTSILSGVQIDSIHVSRSDYGFGISYINSSDRGVYFTFFDNNGTQQFEAVKVNSSGTSNSDLAIIQTIGNVFAISWITGSTLYTREISNTGSLENEKIISVSTSGDTPSMVALTDGDYVISWTESDSYANGIYYEIISRQPTYQITGKLSAVNEGSTATFTLATTNIPSGTSVPYTLSGVSAADISGGSLSGNAVVNSSGVATISVSLLKDALTEGSETLTVTAAGATASTVVYDTSLTPTYFLTVGVNNVVEGGTVAFSLQTTNVPSGTSLPYQISGVSAADIVGGNLSGNVLVSSPYSNESGYGTISIQLVADSLTEGSEYLSVTVGNAFNGVAVEDTSTNSTPTYSLKSLTGGSVNEGTTASFTLTTTNLNSGTSVPYTLSGISTADVSGGSLNGNAVVNSSGLTTISVTLLNDSLTEGSETLTVSAGGATASTLVNDTSKAPTYSIYAGNASYNEGTTAAFTFSATNVSASTALTYTLSGVSSADVSFPLSGTIQFSSGPYGYTFYIPLANDELTEGDETLTVSIGGVSASAVVKDTSQALVSYQLNGYSTSVNEGGFAQFTLYTKNVAIGTTINYTLAGVGITGSDIVGGSLSGTAVVESASFNGFTGGAGISINIAADNLTEGAESLEVYSQGRSSSINIRDTSTTQVPTYSLQSLTGGSVNEGTTATFTLTTTNVASGTSVPYTLSGISAADVSGGSLSGNAVVNSSGVATISVTLLNDSLTEGVETLAVTAGGAGASVLVNDTSVSAIIPTYNLTASSGSVNEGSTAIFTLTTTNVVAGTSVPYSLSGVSYLDVLGWGAPPMGGIFVVDSIGRTTISIEIASDNLTEGTEYLTVIAGGRSVQVAINDTSKAAAVPSYELITSSSSVNEGSVASFNLTTTGVSPGTSISYTISGVSTSDITGGLTGTATVDTNGLATISVPIAADFLTEGTETLNVTAQGKSATVIINDTSKAALVASYALSASTNSVAEGSNAVFTLTTTNVAAGTSVPYTISGLSSTDITGGAATGNAIVSSSGTATITIPIAADLTTEGTETLTVTAQQVSSSILITDTSITPVTVTQPNTTVTSIPYGSGQYFVPTTGADRVTGTAYIDVVKQSSSVSANQIIKLSDGSWQIQNKLTPTNTDTLVNVERIDFTDYSVALDVTGSAGQVAKILGSVFGATYVKNPAFTGIGLAYLDSGMAYKDLAKLAADVAGLTTPDAIVSALWKNVIGSSATEANKAPYIKLLNEGMSVGDLVVLASDSSINLQSINFSEISTSGLTYIPSTVPTVTASPTYSLFSNQATVNEGSSATFTLTTTNVASGTALTYSLSGVSSSDLTSGSLNGSLTIGSNGNGTITIPIAADNLTEGFESLALTVQGATASTVIADTSTTPKPTYSLIPAATSVNEGELARVFVNTTNVVAGTLLDYSITGVSSDDIIGGLTRQVSVDALGQAFINLLTVADQATEGPETMYITLGTSTTSFIINDTSVTIVGVVDTGGGDGGGGGGGGSGGD